MKRLRDVRMLECTDCAWSDTPPDDHTAHKGLKTRPSRGSKEHSGERKPNITAIILGKPRLTALQSWAHRQQRYDRILKK